MMADAEHPTVELRCADVGLACRHVSRAESEEQLMTDVAQHARDAHGVELTETLADYARTRVRRPGR
jgi:predicted small metal-binding protein